MRLLRIALLCPYSLMKKSSHYLLQRFAEAIIPVILQAACALAILGSSPSLALKGRRKRRLNWLSQFVLTHPSHLPK
ncbi:hypothetical protein DF214_08305 [Pectobacterium atrosepticum]|nr:hypothetical protein CVS35_09560 [Pectobacterium atrosepticum]PWD62234.1 hypothetical protein DF214_08305 [Pectobacterium atrosepticum]